MKEKRICGVLFTAEAVRRRQEPAHRVADQHAEAEEHHQRVVQCVEHGPHERHVLQLVYRREDGAAVCCEETTQIRTAGMSNKEHQCKSEIEHSVFPRQCGVARRFGVHFGIV